MLRRLNAVSRRWAGLLQQWDRATKYGFAAHPCRSRSRTPAPPPFSGMRTTPAASRVNAVTAIVVATNFAFGMARRYMLQQGRDNPEINKIFWDIDEARLWIEQGLR